MRSGPALVLAIAVLVASCGNGEEGGGAPPLVSEVRIARPAGANAALYLTARGQGVADVLVGASADVAEAVEIHETVIGSDGMATMRPLVVIEVPASGELVLQPGGPHLMLVEVEPLEVGAVVEVLLFWENAGAMTIEATVVGPADAMGDHDDG